MRKLDKMGELIYDYGAKRFGIVENTWNSPTTQIKSTRQQEIDRLVKERRLLKKRWRKATEEEKEGINVLQAEIKNRLVSLRRAEDLRKRCRKKDQMRSRFFNDPYRFMRYLFAKEQSGRLVAKKEDLEAHLKEVHSDIRRQDPMVLPPDMPPLPSPHYELDISPPKWSEIVETVRHARAASSPGPHGGPLQARQEYEMCYRSCGR